MPARENFTFSDLEQWLNERRVTEVECLVPDLTGVARGKILPRASSPKTVACACRRPWWRWA
jgi:glutamine synthetase